MENIPAARALITNRYPYFASALWALKFVEVKDMAKKFAGPMGVDEKWRVYYDPDVCNEWPIETLCGVLIHELMHLLRRHSARAKAHGIDKNDHMIWNIAADCEINDDLQHYDKVSLPENTCLPCKFNLEDGKSAEVYYDELIKNATKVPMIAEGSGVSSVRQDFEQAGAGRGETSPFEQEAIVKDVANQVKQAGNAPAGLSRWADDELNPKIPWQRVLSALIRRITAECKGRVDYTYSYPNRRQAIFGRCVIPAMSAPTVRASLVVDTSGSMGAVELNAAKSEAEGILSATGTREVTYVSVDAAAHSRGRISRASQIDLQGGGGTNMMVGIRAAMENSPRPNIIIVLTDGYSPWDPEPPTRIPIVVCLINGDRSYIPPWAHVVEVNTNE